MTTGWKPISDAETVGRCWSVIGEIEQALLAEGNDDVHSMSGGSAGLAVFFAYLDAARDGSGPSSDTAFDVLGRSIDALGETVLPPSLYSGFAGIGWAVEHLTSRFFEADEDLCSAIDDGLRELLWLPGQRHNYELIAGLSGYGVYLAERLSNPAANPVAKELLGRIVDLLEETAETSEDGVTWLTLPEWMPPWQREITPGGCYNFGVAHGLPGLLGFLADARRAGFEDPRLPRLAEGLTHWLLGRKLEHENSVFPAMWTPDRPADPTRTAWCYGDPGIAAVLLSAARSFGRPDWEAEALDLARLCARRSEKAAQTVDGGLCHGTAGLAHLFNRFHQATGDPELGDATLAWTRRTLDIRRPGESIAGYPSYLPAERGSSGGGDWSPQPGFLIGAAGVGLALLGVVSDIEPSWDRVLLTAIPPLDLEHQP